MYRNNQIIYDKVRKNRPFPCSKHPHSLNAAKCKTFPMKISFICMIIKNHFHKKGFVLGPVLKHLGNGLFI